MSQYCRIAVKFPKFDSILTYLCPQQFEILPGQMVEVPLGKRTAMGCVIETDISKDSIKEDIEKFDIKEPKSVVFPEFALSSGELELYQWMSKYYHYSLGQLIFESLPKFLKRPRQREILRGEDASIPYEMTLDQKSAFEVIEKSIGGGFERFYVHGVTGSGKSLIYLKLIKKTLAQGKSVLFLLPEINLTPQFTQTFKRYLNCPILCYHSGVSNSEKHAIWSLLKESKEPFFILGVRSSVFLPVENLGLVVVDEEHDSSFKQSDRCPYNGRDVAIKKAQLANCPIVLGSATPTVENYYHYTQMPAHYFSLKNRVQSGKLPKVELLDARDKEADQTFWPLLPDSLTELAKALERKEQALVFVNRLGFANYVQCNGCGHSFTDPNTQTNLRYFKHKGILSSAHSDYQIPMPEMCPECGNVNLLQKGFGTERIAEVLQMAFPDAIIDRFDRDEIKTTAELERKLDRFHKGEIDIFVGTQMLSKGHNFKKVNLVLILGIDSQLSFPDFRAIEKVYQLLTQVSGRAGRFSDFAKVLIQSLNPANKVFEYIQSHSFEGFYQDELEVRDISHYPPFSRLAVVHYSCRFRERLIDHIIATANRVNALIDNKKWTVQLMGPTPSAIEKRSGQYTWSFLLKSDQVNQLHSVLNYLKQTEHLPSGVSYKIDVDPYMIL